MGRCRENLLATSRRCFAAFSTDYIKLFGHLSLLFRPFYSLSTLSSPISSSSTYINSYKHPYLVVVFSEINEVCACLICFKEFSALFLKISSLPRRRIVLKIKTVVSVLSSVASRFHACLVMLFKNRLLIVLNSRGTLSFMLHYP